MVRITESRIISGNVSYVELSCLSTDTKPTANICTGSLALEVDTGDVYAFDEVEGEWCKIASLGGESVSVSGTKSVPVIEVPEGDER